MITPVQLFTVPLQTPLPQGAAAAFATGSGIPLRTRGRLADGEAVVAELAGVVPKVLPPAGPAWRPDFEELLVVLDTAGALGRFADEGIEASKPPLDDGQCSRSS